MSFLITESYLKGRVNISLHKDASAIKIAMQNVTAFYVQELLSTPLYDLYLDHASNGTALTAKQSELFEKAQFYFALMVEYELMFNLFTVSNKGNQEEAGAASIDLIKLKRGEVYSKAEQMKSNILSYLQKNRADFPQYFSDEATDDHPTPKYTGGSSPIVFIDEPKIWLGM